MMRACPAGADARSGHDDETRRPRQLLARILDGIGMTVIPVAMTIGMQLAHARTVASAVFVTDHRARAVAISHDGAVRVWGSSAGPTEAARSDAAFSEGAGSENGSKQGVMTYGAGTGAVRLSVIASPRT
jgi:hypothetical protein